jgi:hypothetical protein
LKQARRQPVVKHKQPAVVHILPMADMMVMVVAVEKSPGNNQSMEAGYLQHLKQPRQLPLWLHLVRHFHE